MGTLGEWIQQQWRRRFGRSRPQARQLTLRARPRLVPVQRVATVQARPKVAHLEGETLWRYQFSALAEMLIEQHTAQTTKAIELFEDPYADLPNLDFSEVRERVVGLRQIPVLKSIARSFQMASRSQQADLLELGDLVRRDPGLHAKILRMVNSSFFALEGEVGDIEHAMILLGINRIRLMAQSLGAVQELNQIATGFDLRHLWSHSFACGLMAEQLARITGWDDQVHAYSAGLMHDVGKIILSSQFPDTYRVVLRASLRKGFDLKIAEQRVFGMDHEQAGFLFANQQNLPEEIQYAMAFHSLPEAAPLEHRHSANLMLLANHFAKVNGLGFSGNPVLCDDGRLGASIAMLRGKDSVAPVDAEASQVMLDRTTAELGGLLPKLVKDVDELVRITFGRSAPAAVTTV